MTNKPKYLKCRKGETAGRCGDDEEEEEDGFFGPALPPGYKNQDSSPER